MTEYTIDDIRGPTVAREMAQLKEFVLAQFNGAIADAEAAAAAAATAAANAVLANTVKKTGEASQSIAGDVAVTGSLDAASIGSGSTPVVCGNLTAFGSVSLDDTTLQGNLSGADSSALINLSGVGSVLVPAPTSNSEAATKKYVDDQDALKISITDVNTYAVGLTGNQNVAGLKNFTNPIGGGYVTSDAAAPGSTGEYVRLARNGQYSQVDIMGSFNGWSDPMILEYDSTANVWKTTTTVDAGQEFKFRLNGSWDINYGGGTDASELYPDGFELVQGAGNILTPKAATICLHANCTPWVVTYQE